MRILRKRNDKKKSYILYSFGGERQSSFGKLAKNLSLNLYRRDATKSYSISSSRTALVNFFVENGVLPRKSLSNNITIVDRIPEAEMRHFIRGYFDGDGCICNYVASHKKGQWNASNVIFVGSERFMYFLKDYMNIFEIKSRISKQKTLFRLTISNKRDIVKLRQLLYDVSTIYLERKRQKFDEVSPPTLLQFTKHIYYRKDRGYWSSIVGTREFGKIYLGSFSSREDAEEAFITYKNSHSLELQNDK